MSTANSKQFTVPQKLLIIALCLGVAGAVWYFASGQASTTLGLTLTTNPDLERGLVGHWTFDGPDVDWSSTTAEIKDRSGQGNHGDAAGDFSSQTVSSGRLGQAIYTPGLTDRVLVSTSSSLDLNDTVSLFLDE